VYLCYGLHMMLNVVADKEGVGAAVLIRSCAPVSGMHTSNCTYYLPAITFLHTCTDRQDLGGFRMNFG
jgi:hypothetical protein